jgi:branched-chain amino acid transport system substrate-binding protein
MARTRCVLFFVVLLLMLTPYCYGQKYIVIGVPTSLKLINGYEGEKAARLAVEEINGKGGVKVGGKPMLMKIEALDIRDGEPGVPVSEALLGIEKLILDKKIYAAVVGNFRSEALLAAMDIYSKYKIINLTSIAMSPKFQEKVLSDKQKYKYSFRIGMDSKYAADCLQGMMKLINKEFGYNKVFIMTQDVLWATTTGSLMEKWFKENGWSVLGFVRFPTGATDFSSALLKVRGTNAQVIMPIFDMPTCGILVKEHKSMKIPAIVSGLIVPVAGTKAWTTFGPDIEGTLSTLWEIGQIPAQLYKPSVDFFDKYRKRWGEEVQSDHGVAPAYDSVYILKAAIEKVGTLDPDRVAKVIEEVDLAGSVGRIKFDAGHQLIFGEDPEKAACGTVFQWQKGKRVIVWPKSIAEGKIIDTGRQ